MIEIERNIPIPPRNHGPKSAYELFQAMLRLMPGDSFVWHSTDTNVYRMAKRVGITIRVGKENGNYRIWRTK